VLFIVSEIITCYCTVNYYRALTLLFSALTVIQERSCLRLRTNSWIRSPAALRCRRHCRRSVRCTPKNVSRHGGGPLSFSPDHSSDHIPRAGDRVCGDGRWLCSVVETAVGLRRLENGRHGVGRMIAKRTRMMMSVRLTIVSLVQRLIVRTTVPKVRSHRTVHLHHLLCQSLVAVCSVGYNMKVIKYAAPHHIETKCTIRRIRLIFLHFGIFGHIDNQSQINHT